MRRSERLHPRNGRRGWWWRVLTKPQEWEWNVRPDSRVSGRQNNGAISRARKWNEEWKTEDSCKAELNLGAIPGWPCEGEGSLTQRWFLHLDTLGRGMVPLTGMGSPVAEPASGRERRRHSVYLESCGIWPTSGRHLCSRWAIGRKMTGGAVSLKRDLMVSVVRGREKHQLKISSTICRQKLLSCFKISSFTFCMNLFNRPFYHRYGKGKCYPNPYGITTNSKYMGPTECKSIMFYYPSEKYFSLMVLVTKNANGHAHAISWRRKISVE